MLLAVPLDGEPAVLSAADAAARRAADVLGATAHGRLLRRWGRSAGGGAYTDAIDDLGFSPNLTRTDPAGTTILPRAWRAIL